MQLQSGWISGVKPVPSPCFNERPENDVSRLLVIHNISLLPGKFGRPWIDALFIGKLDPDADPYFADIAHLQVSAHCLIRRAGEIIQYVPFHLRVCHAGVSVI